MSAVPKISVVMSAYNAAPYLRGAVESILSQSYRDFEFIIINNGSNDDSASILQEYQQVDTRLRVYYHVQNGWVPAQEWACRLARGRYLAMMDADDISHPQRLEKQLAYLESHGDIGIVGTWIQKIDRSGAAGKTWSPPTKPKVLQWTHFFGVCVAHPSVMMRREILQRLRFYRHEIGCAEDVDLWLRASTITEFANIPELLYCYRVWDGSVTQRNLAVVRQTHVDLLTAYIRDFLNAEPDREAVVGLRQTRIGPRPESLRQIRSSALLIYALYLKFVQNNSLTIDERREVSWDAAKRVARLAADASRFSRLDFVTLSARALKLNYRLLSPSSVKRGVELVLQH